MAKRMPTGLFVKELAAALNRGDGYIMGSYGQNPRTGYLDLAKTDVKSSWKETGWYYTQYSGSQRTQALKWRKKCTRVWDCAGMAEGIYEIFSGTCVNTKARYIYANWCSVKGSGMIPAKRRVPGAAVFWSNSGSSSIHHVGYLWKPVQEGHPEGDWYIIEARGVMYGVVKAKLLSRKPNFWGYMDKYYDYSGSVSAEDVAQTVETNTLGSRTLKNGSEGADVKEMQSGLIRLGYDLGSWGADGDFGDCTELAVKQFQKDHGLDTTGKFDAKALKAYEAALVALDKPAEDPKTVEIVGGNCYIRSEAGTNGAVLGVAKRGTEHAFGGEIARNGWIRIKHGDGTAWVSGKYAKANMKVVGATEYALVLYRDKLPKFRNTDAEGKRHMVKNWFEWKRDGREIPRIHPSQKPVALIRRFIEIFTDPGDVVIDPCAGSGSTLRAARDLGRNSYGFEVSADFYRKATEWMLAEEVPI